MPLAGSGLHPSPLTLEGVVVGLDALADCLLQVPLLHTLDPQVLEAKVCPQISVLGLHLAPLSSLPLLPSQAQAPRSRLRFTPCNGFPLCCEKPTPTSAEEPIWVGSPQPRSFFSILHTH